MASGQILTLPTVGLPGVNAVSAASGWGYGSWVELGAPCSAIDVIGVNFQVTSIPSNDVTEAVLLEFGTGTLVSPTVKLQVPWSFRKDTAVAYYLNMVQCIFFPEPYAAVAGVHWFVRAADSSTSARTYEGVMLIYKEGALGDAKGTPPRIVLPTPVPEVGFFITGG